MSLHTECLQDPKCRAAAEGNIVDAGSDWVSQQMEINQGSDWMVAVAIALTVIILIFFVAVEAAVWAEQRAEYMLTRAIPRLVVRIRISAPTELNGRRATSSSPRRTELEEAAGNSSATDEKVGNANADSTALSLGEQLLQLQCTLQVKIDSMPIEQLNGMHGVYHFADHDAAADSIGGSFGVLDPVYGVQPESSFADAKQGSLAMSIGVFRPADNGEAESIVGDRAGGEHARRHFEESLVATLGNVLSIDSGLIVVEHVRWWIPVHFDVGAWLKDKLGYLHHLVRGEFWQYHVSLAFGIAAMAFWAIRRIARISECLFGQIDNGGLLLVLDDEQWKHQATQWTEEYCPDSFASGMVAQGRTSFTVAGPVSIMFACCAPPLGMQGMTDMIKT